VNSEIDVNDVVAIFSQEGMPSAACQLQPKSSSKLNKSSLTPCDKSVCDLECCHDILEVNGLVYIDGFILNKLLSVHTCEHCNNVHDLSPCKTDAKNSFVFLKTFLSKKNLSVLWVVSCSTL